MGSQSKRKKGTKDNRSIVADLKRETDQDANRTALQPAFEGLSFSPIQVTQTDYVDVTDTIDPLQTAGGGGAGGPAPGQVTGLIATAAGDFQIDLDWGIPTGSVDFYNVYMSTTSGFTPVSPIATPTVSNYSVTGLTPGTTYYFKVGGVFNGAEGVISAQASATTTGSAPPPGTLAPPNDIVVGINSADEELNSCFATWSAVPGATGYKYRFSLDPTFAHFWYTVFGSGGAINTGWGQPGDNFYNTTYYFQALTINASGEGYWSATKSVTIGPPPAGAPVPPTGLVLSAGAASATQIVATWNSVPGAIGYRVWYDKFSNFSIPLNGTCTAPTVTITVSSLTPNTLYYFKVAAQKAGGLENVDGDVSAAVSRSTTP